MTNINNLVNNYIDQHAEIKKTLLDGLLNTSSLARKIAEEHNLKNNIDAIISGIRRYDGKLEKKNRKELNKLLRNATIASKTKLTTLIIKRNEETEMKTGTLHTRIELKRDTTLRSIELTNQILLIADDDIVKEIKKAYQENEILRIDDDVAEISISYKDDITKITGVFSNVLQELSLNDIRIYDTIIAHTEQIIIVNEKDLEKAFRTIFNIANS